jgi:hypothetical protein
MNEKIQLPYVVIFKSARCGRFRIRLSTKWPTGYYEEGNFQQCPFLLASSSLGHTRIASFRPRNVFEIKIETGVDFDFAIGFA